MRFFLLPVCVCVCARVYADPLMQLVVDSSRQILYSRSNSNTISVSHAHIGLKVFE